MSRLVRGDDYRQARIGAAAALTAVVVVLLVIDAFSDSYSTDTIMVATLLTTITLLLGLEVRDTVRSLRRSEAEDDDERR